jgi:hypothetical protein
MKRLPGVAAAVALALPTLTGAQSPPRASVAPLFSGRYKLVLTVGPGCPADLRVGTLSVVMNVREATVSAGSEVSGESASSSETSDDGRFVFLRQADRLHGPSGATGTALGLRTLEGYRVWMQIMADGTATTDPGGRSRASGTAFGEIDLARPGDPDADTIGYCQALDHRWSLEPLEVTQ